MTLKIKTSVILVAASLIASASAVAQRAPSEAGKVLETGGPLGSVIVVRGAQAYALQAGDLLFQGDRVVTRANGTARLLAGDCERSLDPVASIVVDEDICEAAPTTLNDDETVAAALGTADIPVGSTPTWLTLLAGGSGAAAAIAGSSRVVD